jgi:VCBS repeat-containing protein
LVGKPDGPLFTSPTTQHTSSTRVQGGGIDNFGNLTLNNSTLSGNEASQGGGIFSAASGTLEVTNSTFSGNSAAGGGAIRNAAGATPALLRNTIVANSTSGGNCSGPISDGGYNLDDGTTCGFSPTNNSQPSTDPKLDTNGLQDNGGPTETIALQPTSTAIDKGKAFGSTTDQRDELRPREHPNVDNATDGDGSDIGAFELQSQLLTIDNVSVTEGDSGTPNATFTVSLSRASPTTSTVQFATADGTAIAATDYQTTIGTLFFKSSTTQTVSVPVIDDSVDELDESFFVNLSNATNAAIYDAQGIGTITDNDPPPNTTPTAEPDSYATEEDTVLSANVLSNDSDPDSGDTLTAVVVNGPTNGELDLNADGSFTYTPNADFNGTDSFTYRASDGSADSNVATVTITVTPVNDAPKIEVVGGTQSTCLSNTSARTTLKLTDVDSSATNLTLSHNSSNTTLLPNSNVTFAASATTLIRTATITTVSGRTGISTVTITVSDDGQASTTTTVRVRAGGNGRDTLSGTSDADILLGQNGDDTLRGLAKSDVLCGANGNDRLTGGDGADHFGGGTGTDTATDFTAGVDTRSGIP